MLLKRKRSESEFSFSPVFSSSHSVNDGFNFNAMSAMDTARRGFFSPRLSVPSHLPSRTLKRFRDSRPPEEEIHREFVLMLALNQCECLPAPRFPQNVLSISSTRRNTVHRN